MSAPIFDPIDEALAPVLAGDPHDDDAQIIDDFFEPASGPADPAASKEDFDDHSQVSRPRITRVLSGYQAISTTFVDPILAMPADANRKSVTIRFTSTTATDYVLVADEANKCITPSTSSGQAGQVLAGADITLGDHTGAVWFARGAGTGVVSWWAVTS